MEDWLAEPTIKIVSRITDITKGALITIINVSKAKTVFLRVIDLLFKIL